MNDTSISRSSSRLVDATYALGNRAEGWDCVNSLIDFYRGLGVDFPEDYQGWNEQNYASRFARDPYGARIVFTQFLMSLGAEVDKNAFSPGDLIIFKRHDGEMPFPGIYLGSGNVLIVCGKEVGIKVFPLQYFRSWISQVRRLI